MSERACSHGKALAPCVTCLKAENELLRAERDDLYNRLSLIAREVDGRGEPDGFEQFFYRIEAWADLSVPVEPWAVKMLGAKR